MPCGLRLGWGHVAEDRVPASSSSTAMRRKPQRRPLKLNREMTAWEHRETIGRFVGRIAGSYHLVRCQELLPRYPRLTQDRPQRRTLDPTMIRHRQRRDTSSRILPSHRDVIALAYEFEAQVLQRSDYARLRRIHRKLHETETPVSATKTSCAISASSSTSLPKVSM